MKGLVALDVGVMLVIHARGVALKKYDVMLMSCPKKYDC